VTSPTANPTVPWAVGGGADNAIEHARMIPWAIYQGAEGILGAGDMEVKALTTPGASVNINPGGYVIVARGLGQTYESYMGKIGNAVNVPVSPNNTGTPRSDLVIVRIEDNHVAGEPWSAPASNDTGPYRTFTVVQGVASTTRSVRDLGNSWSAIALARIDLPAFTSTVTQGMIVPVRTKISPPPPPAPPATLPPTEGAGVNDNPEYFYTRILPATSSGVYDDFAPGTLGAWRDWPVSASWIVPVPKWATKAEVFFVAYSVQTAANVAGSTRINIDNGVIFTPNVDIDYNYSAGGPDTMTVVAAGAVTIPTAQRGKNCKFKVQARTNVGAPGAPGTMRYYFGSVGEFRIFFKEQT
jgi:hypothetical protein